MFPQLGNSQSGWFCRSVCLSVCVHVFQADNNSPLNEVGNSHSGWFCRSVSLSVSMSAYLVVCLPPTFSVLQTLAVVSYMFSKFVNNQKALSIREIAVPCAPVTALLIICSRSSFDLQMAQEHVIFERPQLIGICQCTIW